MEAKDTVIDRFRIAKLIDQILVDYPSAGGLYLSYKVAEEQAEISFKAGIREVVEWVEANLQYPTRGEGLVLERNMEWQAKLKEWGLDV